MPSATLDRPPARRLTQGPRVVKWIEANCVHTNGIWIGKPFRLLPWEKKLIYELFEINPETGLRRYRWAYISVAKKNGKTELAAALALYLLIGDGEPAPLIPCAAASDDQADLVFGAAATMCKMSPTLSQITTVFDKEILVPSIPGAKLKRVAAVAGTNDGQNIQAVICDELHEWQGPRGKAVWTVLTNGTVGRRQPLVIQTTTAGYDLETICGEQYQHAKKVISGEVVDPIYYAYIAEMPEKCDHRDPANWPSANPSYGVLVSEESIRNQLSKPEATFRRYFGNCWTNTETAWLPFGAWDACKDTDLDLDPEIPAHVAVDMALYEDTCAVVVAQKQGERTVIRAKVWANPYPDSHSLHDLWRHNPDEVANYLRELYRRFPVAAAAVDDEPVAGPAFYYDPAYFRDKAAELMGEGLNMVEFPQHDSRMVPASQTFYSQIIGGKIAHDGDPILASHVGNVTAEQKARGAFRMTKPKGSRKKIDAAIAAAIACIRAQEPAPAVTTGDPTVMVLSW
jgi:phage terminase large subunit-like protein